MQLTRVLEFAAVAAVLIAFPGPSVLFIVSWGFALGRGAALRSVVGTAAGEYGRLVAVAAGVGAVGQRSVVAVTAVRVAGAIVLILLGVRAARRRHGRGAHARAAPAAAVTTAAAGLRDGVVVGLTHPTTLVVFTAILPQFVKRAAGRVTLQLLALGLVWVAIALVSDIWWGLAAGMARRGLAGSSRRTGALAQASGLPTIGLGAGLLLSARSG